MKYLDYPRENTLDEVASDPTNHLSVDFEFGKQGPYRVGLSRGGKFVSLPMNRQAKDEIVKSVNSGCVLVGHNMLGADRPFITEIVGREVPLSQYDDTLIYFYATHAHYCKMVKAEEDGDAGRGIGLYDLWSMSSLYTDLPQWKRCRDGLAWNDAYEPPLHCSGPCPVHDHNWYNGVDALAVDLTYPQLVAECVKKKIPTALIDRLKQLTDVCEKMQARGVRVNTALVRQLETEFNETKDRLFETKMIAPPCGVCGRMKEPPCKKCREGGERKKVKTWDAPFAPTSPKQIAKYFAKHGVSLPDTSKDAIEKAMDDCESEEAREWLGRLYDYKQAGKGLKAWFDERFIDSAGLIHPRFNPCGTSTGRLASSSPNCFDAKTEVLTEKGWLPFPEAVREKPRIAQWDDGKISFVKPTEWFEFDDTHFIQIKTRATDLKVTSDHRCLIKNRSGDFKTVAAAEYPEDYKQLHAGMWNGATLHLDLTGAELRFIVALQADGSLCSSGVDFSFKKARKAIRLVSLMKEAGIPFRDYSKPGRFRYLAETHRFDKFKTFRSWVFDLTRNQIDFLLDELFYWDGTFKYRNCYYSADEENIDVIQALFSLSGRRSRKRYYKNSGGSGCYCLDLARFDYSWTTNRTITKCDGSEKAYCVSVPSSYIVVRRNGCVMITGQCQNIPKVGFGQKVRAAIIPREKELIMCKADFKQLEFRMVLWYAYHYILKQPYPGVSGDAFTWLVENSNGAFADAARIMQRDERSVAKSIVHAADYLEGVRSYSSNDIRSERFKQDVSKGCIVLYRDWVIDGKYIGFTGVNLARRLFGSATADNRRKALAIQETYFNAYPFIRQWHKSLSHWVEKGYVSSHTGRYLKLFGTVEERLKDCAAFLGQGGGADYVQEAMIASTEIPTMQIHDELLYERPRTLSAKQQLEFMKDTMERESNLFEGFRCPIDAAMGENWLEMEAL